MNVFERLDFVKPYNGFAKLTNGYRSIEKFRAVKNRFGKKSEDGDPGQTILVELKDQVVFLPQYWCEKISPSDMEEMNKMIQDKQEVYLYFGGKYKSTK